MMVVIMKCWRDSFATNHEENIIHCRILIFCPSSHLLRHIGESVVTGSDCLWPGPVWRLPVCVLEALLDTMEGACSLPHHQGGPWAPQPDNEPSALAPFTQAASLHSRGPPASQPPWVITLLHRQGAHSCGICGVSGGSINSSITTTCGRGHTWGSYEDQSHISGYPTGCPD